MAKPQAIKAEMAAVWQDHVGRALAQGDVGGASSKEESVDVDEAEDISCKNLGSKACSIICLQHCFDIFKKLFRFRRNSQAQNTKSTFAASAMTTEKQSPTT